MDILGVINVKEAMVFNIFSIVDDYPRATWVRLFSHKSNKFPIWQAFVMQAGKEFDAIMKVISFGSGLEFPDFSALNFYVDKGIVHQTSCVERP